MIITEFSMMSPIHLKLIILMVCVAFKVVGGEHEIKCLEREREALLRFKASLHDPNGMLSSWTTADCCQWKRIHCNNLTGNIVSLDPHAEYDYETESWSYISGEIHESLIELQQLKYLNLSFNSFSNNYIPEFLGSLSNLRYLDLSWCFFGGKIPSQFGSLSHLKYLNLAGNGLQGLIPTQLKNLSKLEYLDLSYNSFEGNIPSQIGNLSNLQQLYLEGAYFNDGGKLLSNLVSLTHLYLISIHGLNSSHSWLQKLSKLRELSLIDCSLSDHFILSSRPSKFNFSTSLLAFHLSVNTFTSPVIFEWLTNITSNLVELDLADNNLEGSVFNHFGMAMNSLEHLDLSDNTFKGEVLKSFMNICTLHSLYMQRNNFTEDLPSVLHELSSGCVRYSLQDLDLTDNHITGSLSNLSTFPALKSLYLSRNQLNGKIAEGNKLPTQLEILSISQNFLKGGIPKSFGNACALSTLDMSYNNLSDELSLIIHHLSGCARYSLEQLYLRMNKISGTLPDLSIFSSLKVLHVDRNLLNGEIHKDIQFPPLLEELDMHSSSLYGVFTDHHFVNVSKLSYLDLSDNSLTLTFTQNWIPPFQLSYISLRSCILGPTFPKWLQTQNEFLDLDISNSTILDMVPRWFWAKLALGNTISIDISNNGLYGIIPNFSGKNIVPDLNLASNQFEGSIPLFLRGSGSLDLSNNNFTYSHSFICSGSDETLYQLDLSNNNLFGQIPDCWSHFKSLTYLDLSHNKFSGKIPTSLGSLLGLQVLLLRNNNLSGHIPTWIGSKMQELQILSLGSNNFNGIFPLQICYLKNIQILDLSLNNLSGKIPTCINNFTSMVNKTFSSGYESPWYILPNDQGSTYEPYLKAFLMWKGSEQIFKTHELLLLRSIDLSSNNFLEEIPMEIENLVELISLNLSRNNFTEKIPSNIGNLKSLEFLDLSRNQFVGSIPQSLAQIDRLTMLDLSYNHLSGVIPTSTQLQSFNISSYEDNLNLCGLPLKKLCNDDGLSQEPQEPVIEIHEHSLFDHEFYISMALGFTISFWIVFGSILFNRSWRHAYFKFFNHLIDDIYMVAVKFANCKWSK
ncbi:receptor-like protein EIX2 [Vigna umbellata]|uniref:receptor-like protein EIX2 n=1 Tax=Vigna umbellata TaxID=87088 RepID=UPI001F5F66E0|nr:receptor-like protein EIX2 [Vigna umbellata]